MSQTPYTNVTAIKNYLKIAPTDTSNDAFLTLVIPQVMAFVDSYTGRTFGWGDTGDSLDYDYSNTGSLGISSAVISGTSCVFSFYAGTPFVTGSVVNVSGFVPTQINGTWTVTGVSGDKTAVTVDLGMAGVTDATQMGIVCSSVTNYKFKQQESYDGLVGSKLYLRNMDIRSVDAVWLGSRNIYPPTLLDPNQYIWRDDGRLILGGNYFNTYNSAKWSDNNSFFGSLASGYQTVTISYHYGVQGVPMDIALAVEDIISAMYRLRTSQGVSMEQAGDYRIQYNPTLRTLMKDQPDTLGILDRYKRVNV